MDSDHNAGAPTTVRAPAAQPWPDGTLDGTPGRPRLRTGAGTSLLDDPVEAGRSAAATAVAQLDGASAGLVLVYATARYDLPALLAGVRDVTGDTPLAGATSGGQFFDGRLDPPGQGVAVMVLSAEPYRFGVAMATGLLADADSAGRELTRAARAAAGVTQSEHAAMLLLADGFSVELQGLLNGVYRVAGADVPVVGGAAAAIHGHPGFVELVTNVFYDDQVLSDAAVGVWIESDHPLRVVFGHGWQPNSLPMLVTRSENQVVHEIDGRSAVEVYREHFRYEDPKQDLLTPNIREYHAAHAFGLIEPDGSQLIRGAYFDDDGNVCTFAPLPPYCAVQVVSADPDDLLAVSEQVITDALGDSDASVILTFSCVARLDILRERSHEEAHLLQTAAGNVPTFGFYTYGEFARTNSVTGYHNATIAALAL